MPSSLKKSLSLIIALLLHCLYGFILLSCYFLWSFYSIFYFLNFLIWILGLLIFSSSSIRFSYFFISLMHHVLNIVQYRIFSNFLWFILSSDLFWTLFLKIFKYMLVNCSSVIVSNSNTLLTENSLHNWNLLAIVEILFVT